MANSFNGDTPSQKVHWEASGYDRSMGFVSQYGEDVVQWLNPLEGERIVDFGCGTGDLSAKIAESGAITHGVDISPEMVDRARAKFPHLKFECADGSKWKPDFEYDAVFSNAALHWMKDAEGAIASMTSGLRGGGRLVAEFGGYGNVANIVEAVKESLAEEGRGDTFVMPWFFPTIGQYGAMLEKQGVEVRQAVLFDRPTPLENGEEGMKDWLRMFGEAMFPNADEADADRWMDSAVSELKRPERGLYAAGRWTADYRRIRIYAIKG
ncbi:class I SAM-dependent methyltransferase [Cohnella suwonensis]|uniref:Class I SAM-dependent methyltransferase n=1 Tax=Cohnella suwonensis TaxID=696072 RepID=A0ABW0LVA4_9BACL